MKLSQEFHNDCLTKEKLAQEWECSVEDIDFLINDKSALRLAAKTSEIPISGLYRYSFPNLDLWSGLSKIFKELKAKNPEADFHFSHFPAHQNTPIPKSEIIQPSIKEDLPRYLYRVFSNDIQLDRQPFAVQDIQGISYYMLTGWCHYDTATNSYFNPEYLCLDDRYFEHITIEELARFESENMKNEVCPETDAVSVISQNDSVSSAGPHGLPWIEKARELAMSIKRDFPKRKQREIANEVHELMVKRNITGRGGRVPTSGTIKKQALKGIV